MTKKIYKNIERQPSHPGHILKSGFIEQYNLSISNVAKLLGLSREHLSRIVNGHCSITAEIAAKLEILTQTPASQWLTLQANYNSYILKNNSHFNKYSKALEEWLSINLNMRPKERALDKKSFELAKTISKLAKSFDKGNKPA